MSCNNNPCVTPSPCDPYDNCGCINSNTFNCTNYSGPALSCTGIAVGDDGNEVLSKIDEAICDTNDNKGKVAVDANDDCPQYLFDKFQEGANISLSLSGTGCNRKIIINATEGGVPVDVNAKVSSNDLVSGYLYEKITNGSHISKDIINPSDNEKLELDVDIESLISSDEGNQLTLGDDGLLKTSYTAPDGSETKLVSGVGVTITGSGTNEDPYVTSTNPAIQVARSCFDGVWRPITIVTTGNSNVVFTSGAPEYRYRFDGTLEFRGPVTYTVSFGAYSTSNRKFTVTIGNIPTTCISLGEQAGTTDLKNVNYIDVPQASADQITQMYGYTVRKSAQNIILEFQSSFTNATAKSVVVNFDGVISHPHL